MGPVTQLLLLLALASHSIASDRYHPAARSGPSVSVPLRNTAEATADYWNNAAQAQIERMVRQRTGSSSSSHARNVVMFLGDGMSVPTLAAARTLLGQRRGQTGEEAALAFEEFPSVGLSKVSSRKLVLHLHVNHMSHLYSTCSH